MEKGGNQQILSVTVADTSYPSRQQMYKQVLCYTM